MNLLQQIKGTKTRGAQVHAVVEMALMGRATVILVGSQKRMTNLPVYGKEVSSGDKVIIDYSAEGQPYVRSSIEYEDAEDPGIEVIFHDAPVDSNDGFVAGKAGLAANRVFSDTIAGDTFTWIPIIFDNILYDNYGLWNSSGFFGELPSGQYLATVNLGFSTSVLSASGYAAVQLLNYKASTGALTPIDFRIAFSQNVQFYSGADHNIHIVNFSTLARITDTDEAIGVALSVYTSYQVKPTILKDYSSFSIHKLKNLIPESTAVRGFWDTGGTYF